MPEGKHISYKTGYKYQLGEDYVCIVDIKNYSIITEYIDLDMQGLLKIKKGYAWDGPSGPTIDTKNFMRGSLVHDALYQLLREKRLLSECRLLADKELKRICIEDGMSKVRAWYVYKSVRKFAGPAADEKNVKKLIIAP